MKSCQEINYIGDKPNPEHWADLLDNDEDFREEFERVFNSDDVMEADDVTPDTLDDVGVRTCVI